MIFKCDVIRFEINDGIKKRPLYLGCLAAEDLEKLCRVPSFSPGTEQEVIAGNVLRPPIQDWQRPLIQSKRDKIQERYDQPGEFMPNPVLLSVDLEDAVQVKPKFLDGNATGLHILEVEISNPERVPLLILDGQHRIAGLSRGKNKKNPLPFVLLHSEIKGTYPPQDSAKIFAEVSTESTGLKELHREWMQFAFHLDTYDPSRVNGPENRSSMEVAAYLCHERDFVVDGKKISNPFLNCVQFNPEKPARPAIGKGMAFSATQIKSFVLDEYFQGSPASGRHLKPLKVAAQIAAASLALQSCLGTPLDESVFFGAGAKHHQYMEHGFVRAVLVKLLEDPTPDWYDLLIKLGFGSNIWDFSSWVKTTGGNYGNSSRKVARTVLIEAFRKEAVPNGSSSLVDYFQSDKAEITFVGSYLLPSGRPQKKDRKTITYNPGSVRTVNLGGRSHLRIDDGSTTSNIAKIDIFDDAAPRAKEFTFSTLKRGVRVDRLVRLNVQAQYYGGLEESKVITIDPT